MAFFNRGVSSVCVAVLLLCLGNLPAQQSAKTEAPASVRQAQPGPTATPVPATTATPVPSVASGKKENRQPVRSSRILGIIPNYRTIEEHSPERVPLTPKQKYKMAVQDSFDPSAFLVAAILAGTSMAEAQYRQFGGGFKGFGKYYAAAYADQAIGNFFTEAILPSALHQDPQYYTKAHGGFWRRTGYALEREVVTFGDNGHNQFNTSEIAGNALAAAISTAYYPSQQRKFSSTAEKWAQQIGTDVFFNVLKEFWPDVRTRVFRK